MVAAPDPSTYLPGQLLVKYAVSPAGVAAKARAHPAGTRVKAVLPTLGWQVLELPPGTEVSQALDYYRGQPGVAYAEPNYRIRLFATPNDPRRAQLWGLDKIGAPVAWDQTTGSSEVVVAMLDTGLDYTHADLAANVWTNPGEIAGNGLDDDQNGYTDDLHGLNTLDQTGNVQDDVGHGTHVAGTIGALGNNALGVVGINWRVKLLSVKIFSADDSSGTAGAVQGYEYLIALKQKGVNIRVANNSWGGMVPSRALAEAMRAAEAVGILSVCAAGNDNHDTDARPEYPAGNDGESFLSVAASTRDDELASFSNYGARTVHLAAPGEAILSTYRGAGHYQQMSGTSMACPHVSGAAALLLAQSNSLTPTALKALLLATVDPLPRGADRLISGGRLNVGRAMARLMAGPLPSLAPVTNGPAQSWPQLSALSRTAAGRWGNDASYTPSISADGAFVAFVSTATNLVPGTAGSRALVYLLERATGVITLVSRASGGGLPSADCSEVRLSGDGRCVVFSSAAANLVANDNNSSSDVFLYDRVSGQTELISVTGTSSGNAASDSPAVSADGRYVVFASDASNLVTGDNNGYRDIFLRDRQTHATTRVSVSAGGVQADYTSDLPSLSSDGRYITYLSGADNLVADTYYPAYHLYLRDRTTGATERLSKTSASAPGNNNCGASSLSADGRFVAFESRASNLVTGDTNKMQDIFLWDRVSRVLQRVSLANQGFQADQDCWSPWITDDGRHVYFFSQSGLFSPEDDNTLYSLFAYDRLGAKLSQLSYNQAGQLALDYSFSPTASADGQFVAFDSWAWNLVPGDGNGTRDALLLDLGTARPDLMVYQTGDTNLTGIGLRGTNLVQRRQASLTNGAAVFLVRLDNDGPSNEVFLVRANPAPAGWSAQFFFGSTNLTTALTGAGWTATLAPGSNLVLRLETASTGAALGEAWAEWFITAAGTRSNAATDAVRAVVTRTPSPPSGQVVSRTASGRLGDDSSEYANLSGDGRFVTFTSGSVGLSRRDYNLQDDVFLLDRQTGVLECVTKLANGTNANGRSYYSKISRDGRYVVYQSSATNLVAGDTNDREDVFLFDRQTRATTRVSVGAGGAQSARDSGWASLSAEGRYLAFESLADTWVAGDTNGTWDVFLRDTVNGTVQCLSLAGSQTANDESHLAAMSSDGSLVVLDSLASNLAPNDTNGVTDLFLWQRGVSGLRLLSRTANGSAASDSSDTASISDDNRLILFSSLATNLAVPNYDPGSILFLYDVQSNQLSQLNPARVAGRQRGSFYGGRLAPDGRRITLLADVSDAPGHTNYVTSAFLYDRLSGDLTELSRTRAGQPANGYTGSPVVSADGRYVALRTRAANLLGEANPGLDQVLLYDRASFQPDEWIRRGSNAPDRGQGLLTDSAQRVEQTLQPGAALDFFVTLRNQGTTPDRFVFQPPTGIVGGLDARYFLQPAGTEISVAVTNGGWTSDLVAAGDTRELRIHLTASNTNLFELDLTFACVSLNDPAKTDLVRLRLLRDDDNDGLPNVWEQRYFGHPTNALASADPDLDGVSNLAEYIAGTDPTRASSRPVLSGLQPGPGPSVTVTWPSVTNRYYVLERALGSPLGFTPLAELPGGTPNTSYQDPWPTNPPPAFYRLRVDLP